MKTTETIKPEELETEREHEARVALSAAVAEWAAARANRYSQADYAQELVDAQNFVAAEHLLLQAFDAYLQACDTRHEPALPSGSAAH